jgi:hypothetical protein
MFSVPNTGTMPFLLMEGLIDCAAAPGGLAGTPIRAAGFGNGGTPDAMPAVRTLAAGFCWNRGPLVIVAAEATVNIAIAELLTAAYKCRVAKLRFRMSFTDKCRAVAKYACKRSALRSFLTPPILFLPRSARILGSS